MHRVFFIALSIVFCLAYTQAQADQSSIPCNSQVRVIVMNYTDTQLVGGVTVMLADTVLNRQTTFKPHEATAVVTRSMLQIPSSAGSRQITAGFGTSTSPASGRDAAMCHSTLGLLNECPGGTVVVTALRPNGPGSPLSCVIGPMVQK